MTEQGLVWLFEWFEYQNTDDDDVVPLLFLLLLLFVVGRSSRNAQKRFEGKGRFYEKSVHPNTDKCENRRQHRRDFENRRHSSDKNCDCQSCLPSAYQRQHVQMSSTTTTTTH